MIIYSNGCSHTVNFKYQNVYIDIVANEILKGYKTIYAVEGWYYTNKIFKFTDLSENKNYLIKHAEHGKSNDLIFFESYNIIKNAIKNNVKLDFVVIQFSGVNRRVHTKADGSLLKINPCENSEYGIKFEPFATEQSLQYLIILQDLLNNNSINHVFIPYMEFDNDVLKKSDKLDYIDNERLSTSLFSGHRNEFRKKGYAFDTAGHPNCYGHYYLASIIIDKFGFDVKDMKDLETYFSKIDIDEQMLDDWKQFIKNNGEKLGEGTKEDVDKIILKRNNLI